MTEEEYTFGEFKNAIDQLNPQDRQDVLDYMAFLIWTQAGQPAPVRRVVRGAWLYLKNKLSGGKP